MKIKLSRTNTKTFALLIILTMTAFYQGKAQQTEPIFTIDLEIRPRFEYRNGFKKPIEKQLSPAGFVEQRSRIKLGYVRTDLDASITLQDIRIWGNHNQIYKVENALTNVYEAWARYHISDRFSFKVGRQALNYDNARFLGDLDWAQQGRSHDALLFQIKNNENSLLFDLGLTLNNQINSEPTHLSKSYYGLQNNNLMQFIWVKKTFSQSDISFLLHNDERIAQIDSSSNFRQTIGLQFNAPFKQAEFHSEFYLQTGKDNFKRDVLAWFANAELSHPITDINLTIGLSYSSGTELKDTGKNHSFNPLYGTNHKFYGYMDYFYAGNAHNQPGSATTAGLINLYERIALPFSKSAAIQLDIHHFWSPTTIYNASNSEMSGYLGTEIDLVGSLKPAKDIVMQAGVSGFIFTDTLERLKGSINPQGVASWVWISMKFNPQIFSTHNNETR